MATFSRPAGVFCAILTLASVVHAAPAASPATEPRTIEIHVSDEGYEPAKFEVNAGETRRLAFTSSTDADCTGTVQSKDLGIPTTHLQKGKRTVIEIKPDKAGEFTFACAMGMISGTVVVKKPS